jgi:HAD superfamily hydrolase (TIGR01509 family)
MTAVVFDLDGVLVNSEPYWQESFLAITRQFCAESGYAEPPYVLADMARFEGGRVNDTMRTILTSLGHEQDADRDRVEALAQRVIRRVSEAFRKNPAPIAENVRVARELADRGIPLGVASSSAQEFIDAALEQIGLADAVAATQSAYHLEHGKPHPEVYLLTLDRMGVSAKEAVAIEDSTTGIGSAVRAGLRTIWYLVAPEESDEAAKSRLRATLGEDGSAADGVLITRALRVEDVEQVMATL